MQMDTEDKSRGAELTPIRWGILGPGAIAEKFATGLAVLEDAELAAIGSRDLTRAEAFAHRLLRTANSAPQRVEHAYSLALGRAPTSDELNASLDFVAKYAAASGSDHAAWSALARTLLTRNEFLFVD